MDNYVIYHMHSSDSLLDSASSFEEEADLAKLWGMKAIGWSEHHNNYDWFAKYMYCKKIGLKFLYGIEVYLTKTLDEKIRDNYHTVLIAKNYDGFVELNNAIEKSNRPDHQYYKHRMTFDEFFALSGNIIKTSACLASPLSKYPDKDDEIYDRLCRAYDYFEIQYHDIDEQKEYNKYLWELSKKYHKPLIAATDTHSSTQYKAECRMVLKYGKTNGEWGDGENSLDLTEKSYPQLCEAFEKQNALPREVWMAAIEETNKMADSCEELQIDCSLKYPESYPGQDEEKIMWDRIKRMYNEKVDKGIIDGNNPQYIDNIKEEMRVFKKINMIGFMLFMSELMCWAREKGLFTSPCRGSVGGSTVAYITDIIDVDPVKRHTIFSRFANEYREEVGDYQHSFPVSRGAVKKSGEPINVGCAA